MERQLVSKMFEFDSLLTADFPPPPNNIHELFKVLNQPLFAFSFSYFFLSELKVLPASHHSLSILCAFIRLASATTANPSPYFCPIILNTLCQTTPLTHNKLTHSCWNADIFSDIFQNLLISALSSVFSKSVNLLESFTWYCSSNFASLSFLRSNICTQNFSATHSLTNSFCLHFTTTKQGFVVCNKVSTSERPHMKHTWLSSSIKT